MRLKALLVAMLAGGLAASVAAAAPPPGKSNPGLALGTPTPVARNFCGEARGPRDGRPTVMLVLEGEFVSGSADATGDGSFVLLVERASKHARSLRGRQVTVEVDRRTKFRRRGEAELTDLREGDRLVVHARAASRAGGTTLLLPACRVAVRPSAPAGS
jgi:hypothetical protein